MSEEIIKIRNSASNLEFNFLSTPTVPALISEIFNDNYKVFERNITFSPGDSILDLGANEGLFSILMAKSFPFVAVFSFEPVQSTFMTLIRNIALNNITNISPYNMGVGAPGHSSLPLICDNLHSGGASGTMTLDPRYHHEETVELLGLDDIFAKFSLSHVRLLKIDIEGMEYQALYPSTSLPLIDYVVAEFHINELLKSQGYDINELATFVGSKSNLIYFERCKMHE